MLIKVTEFVSVLYGLPLIIIFNFNLLLLNLESLIHKKKNSNKLSFKITYITGRSGIVYNIYSEAMFYLSIIPMILLIFNKAFIFDLNNSNIILTNDNLKSFYINFFIMSIVSKFIISKKTVSQKGINNFTITIILQIIPYLHFINSLVIFLFFIEALNILLFILLISSIINLNLLTRVSKSNNKILKYNNSIKSSIFIFYIFSFLFSIFFLLFIIHISRSINFIDIYTINIFYTIDLPQENINQITTTSILFILIKLGLPPLHLQKIAVYKGYSLNLVLVYSFIIFLSYLHIIINLIYEVPQIFIKFKEIFKPILIIGIFSMLIFIFKENNLKAFFGLSSLINLSMLLLVLIID